MGTVREKFAAVLQQAQHAGNVVSIYHLDGDTSKFEVGFVEAVNGEDLTLRCLNARGEDDGHIVLRLDDVDVVEVDDAYSRKVQLLHEYQGSVFAKSDGVERGDSYESLLEMALRNRWVMTAEDHRGHKFVGFVSEIGDDFFELELLTTYGEPDGKAAIQKASVVRIEVNRRDEQTRAFLYRYHYELKRLLEP